MVDINIDLLQWFINFLIKKNICKRSRILQTKNQLKNYRNQLSKKFKERKVHSPFIVNIWVADLTDMQLISKINKGFKFSLHVIDIYSKYAWVIPLKDKKGITITNAFENILKESNRKPNKT